MMAEYGQVDQEILMREVVPTDQDIEVEEEVVEEEEEDKEAGGMNQEDQNLEDQHNFQTAYLLMQKECVF